MDKFQRLASMGRKKFLLRKCLTECGEKGGTTFVVSLPLVLRVPWKVTAHPPSSVAVFVSSNSLVLCHLCSSVCACVWDLCVAAPIRALDFVKRKRKTKLCEVYNPRRNLSISFLNTRVQTRQCCRRWWTSSTRMWTSSLQKTVTACNTASGILLVLSCMTAKVSTLWKM